KGKRHPAKWAIVETLIRFAFVVYAEQPISIPVLRIAGDEKSNNVIALLLPCHGNPTFAFPS
ncbi:MAG: hypothetical protein WA426_18825, partial [Silvibacterium sp.]